MSRNTLTHVQTTCRAGINQQPQLAVKEEAADALNVWAPDGEVVQRPGYTGVSRNLSFKTTTTGLLATKYDGSYTNEDGTGALTIAGLSDGDYLYVGHASSAWEMAAITNTTLNTATSYASTEYWNGSAWVGFNCIFVVGGTLEREGALFSGVGTFLAHTNPSDWATTSVNSRTGYWVRLTIRGANLSAGTAIDVTIGSDNVYLTGYPISSLAYTQFSTAEKFGIALHYDFDTSAQVVSSTNSLKYDNHSFKTYGTTGLFERPGTSASVPQFEEFYLAQAKNVSTMHPTVGIAQVEDREFAVGPGAAYDPEFVPQLGNFPKADLITFFAGRLWAAGIEGKPYNIRWSAPQPYHRVWPELSVEVLMEDDKSPITAIKALGEHLVVFKQDSIWIMLDTGLNAFELQTYQPKRIVAGVGCVAQGSVQQVRGRLIFLAEDGVYAFDGTPNIEKLSDRVQDTVDSIRPGRRSFASAVNWRTKSVYLLSVSTGKDTANNTTLVWDYRNNTWWLWDNIDAQHWLNVEGVSDFETLYFGDVGGRIFQFDSGKTDNGAAITSTVLTQRLGLLGNVKHVVRQVELSSTNRTQSLTVEVRGNDEPSGDSGTIDLTDNSEVTWDDLAWQDQSWVGTRRRNRRQGFRKECDWFQVKVTHNTKNQPFTLAGIDVGVQPMGRR